MFEGLVYPVGKIWRWEVRWPRDEKPTEFYPGQLIRCGWEKTPEEAVFTMDQYIINLCVENP